MPPLNNKAVNNPQLVPDLKWKEWTYRNLPSSDNNWITDIDSVIRTRNGCFYLIEIKRKNCQVPTWQKLTYAILAEGLRQLEGQNVELKGTPFSIQVKKFGGVIELIFENTFFDDGKTYWSIDGSLMEEVSEDEVRHRLSFSDDCCDCFPPNTPDCIC